MQFKKKMSNDVVSMHLGAPDVNLLAGTKTTRSKSMRKRKFTSEELEKTNVGSVRDMESDFEGPFWFETSTTSNINGDKVHAGITRRERQLLSEIVKSGFFTTERLKNTLVPLNDESSKTPRLRAFDWAVTNFSKGSPSLHIVDGKIVDPNLDYQNELKKHHRLLFDPFRRGTHLFFEVEDISGTTISKDEVKKTAAKVHRTTVGQLCFIKWCIEHQVDRYVEENLEAIRAHMSATTKKNGNKKRRRELTSAPTKIMRGAVFDTMTIK
jgi:hypothetical protein